MSKITFQNIGLQGHNVGMVNFKEDKVEWRDRHGTVKEIAKEAINSFAWSIFGGKGHLRIEQEDGHVIRLDGFAKSDHDQLSKFTQEAYTKSITTEVAASGGVHYGNVELSGKMITMKSIGEKKMFELPLDNVSLCVVPLNNKDELEIQFKESDNADKEEDRSLSLLF